MRIIYTVLLSSLLIACSHHQPVSEPAETVYKPIKIQCGSVPPLQNTVGIRANLLKNGTLSESMSEAEQQDVVNAYIAKRNNAYKKCKQGK